MVCQSALLRDHGFSQDIATRDHLVPHIIAADEHARQRHAIELDASFATEASTHQFSLGNVLCRDDHDGRAAIALAQRLEIWVMVDDFCAE